MRLFVGIWLWCFPLMLQAQFTYVVDQSIPVTNQNNEALPLAWAGGLNAAQYNTMDINGDDQNDLILFDRTANKVITFLNIESKYVYAPEYESMFPTLTNWLLLRDYNCDGRKDLFTGDVLGIRVYQNITAVGEPLAWEPFLFYDSASQTKSQVLLTIGAKLTNLQLQYDDLPSITDIDGDGDLDILCMRYQGEGSIEFHRNYSKEKYQTCDSLRFKRVTMKWGDVVECECGVFAFNNTECPPSSGGRVKHAGGKALLAMDIDNDSDKDLLFSEAQCSDLFLLRNEGNATTAVFSNAVNFPETTPARLTHFPAPFYEDVNFDNVSDLIVVPNIFNKDLLEIDLKKSNWLYDNNGSEQVPSFLLQQKDLLQDQMIDVGDNAVPAFFDLDGDGDQDMVIGNHANADTQKASLSFYENTGTAEEPAFKFKTDNYLDLASQSLYNVKPQFADVNSDGKVDLLLTATSKITGLTRIYYSLNKRVPGVDFSNQAFTMIDFGLLQPENVLLTDVDSDGIPDLLVGRSNGSVEYWKNNGPSSAFNFILTDDSYAGLGSSVERHCMSLAAADLDGDRKPDLIMGDQFGTVAIIPDYRSGSGENRLTNIALNPLSEEYTAFNMGGRCWVTTTNLFNTDKPCIIAGNIMGGLRVLTNDNGKGLPEEPTIDIYPVPVEQSRLLNVKVSNYATIRIVSLLGQEMSEAVSIYPDQIHTLQVSKIAAGVYILRLQIGTKTYSRRIVIY